MVLFLIILLLKAVKYILYFYLIDLSKKLISIEVFDIKKKGKINMKKLN